MNSVTEQARQVERRPSEAQKEAGNYRKGHVRIHGMEIAIENPCGSFRTGASSDGKVWRCRLPAHYGYLKRTEARDGDQVDAFIGPHHKSPLVYVIDQHDADHGKYDEAKVMLGFATPAQARHTYLRAFSDGKARDRLGAMHEMTVAQFKQWLKDGDTTQPYKRAAGGRIAMADGGVPVSDPALLAQLNAPTPVTDPALLEKLNAPDTAQPSQGLSAYIPAAIRDVPHEMYQATANQISNIGQSGSDIMARHSAQAQKDASPGGSFFDPSAFVGGAKDVMDVGKALLSGASVPFAPIQGAAQSLIGHPMAQAEHAIGTVINPAAAARDNPAEMYERSKEDVATALSAARPRGFTARGPISVPPPVAPEAAANQAAANEFGFRLSRGQATQDLDTIRYEDMAARGAYGPEAQKRAAEFFDQQFKDSQAGGQSVGQNAARGAPELETPSDSAATLQSEVAQRAEQARVAQAETERQAQAEAAAQRGMVDDRQRAMNDAIRGGALPVEGPREAGEVVGQNVRDAAAANRQEFRDRYREMAQLPGEFRVDAIRGIGTRIRNDLSFRDDPVVVDDQLTPSASRAIQALDEMSVPRIQNRASAFGQPNPDEIAGVNLRGIDQMRKKLVAYYQSARANPTDARAVRAIMDGYDGQIERAITEGLFSGDPRALEALQEARASYSRYRQTFGPQRPGDDVGTAMRRIVDRNATPEETANMIIGSGKIGNAGLPVRIADRLEQVLGADSDSWSAIRQAMWQKASQIRNAAGEVDPNRSASSITEFTNSSLARRMFTDQERAAMRSHAQGVRDLDRTIEQLPETQQANRARENYQQVFGTEGQGGPSAAVFRRMVEGNATPEEITNGVFKVIGSGNPGHVLRTLQAIERIVGHDSEAMSAVRQGIWQKLTQNAVGKDQPGAQKAMQAINEFLNGSGRTIAHHLYSPGELVLMDRYQKALKLTIIPKYARTNSDTAPALLAAVRKYAGMVGSALGLVTQHGGPAGGLEGYAVGKLLDKAVEKVSAAHQARKLNNSLEDVVPPARKPVPPPRLRQARLLPLAMHSAPTRNISAVLARLQGPAQSSADDKKPKP